MNPKNDHTYAENSDVPTEPYGSDSDSKLDTVTTGVNTGGRLIVASMDKLEISVEYANSTALSEATGTISTTENASEMLLDASNAGIVCPNSNESTEPLLLDELTDNEALLEVMDRTEHSNEMLSDVTPKMLPDATNKLLLEATIPIDLSGTSRPDETTETPPRSTETNSLLPEATINNLES